jgi:16S rRNA (uracil1498-N3)-methyltransferase
MHLFYTPDINAGQELYTLSEEESKHCVRVLRMVEGDQIRLIDGKGIFYNAVIADANPKRCTVSIHSIQADEGKRSYYVHIAVAPTKNTDRLEWFLEKSTEIGIDEISPIECEHSERAVVKTDRLNRVITAAMKQSIKAFHPQLNELRNFKELIAQSRSFEGNKYIAHCRPDEKKQPLKQAYQKGKDVLILIGPEGDFSIDEVKLAVENGFAPISLGTSRLRTETAALVACHTISLLND